MNRNLSPLAELEGVILKRKSRAAAAKQNRKLIWETFKMIMILAVAVTLFFSFFSFKIVNGNEMYPALRDGDLMLVWRRSDYDRGDIVFYKVDGREYCGRVVASGGDRIRFTEDGTFYVNGTAQTADVLFPTYSSGGETEEVIPPNTVYILGDFRTECTDSRVLGAVPLEQISGRAISFFRHKKI